MPIHLSDRGLSFDKYKFTAACDIKIRCCFCVRQDVKKGELYHGAHIHTTDERFVWIHWHDKCTKTDVAKMRGRLA